MSGGHGAIEGSNKRVALLISVLALFLAFSETLGKAAQTDALGANIEASNLWAYFQARTIRSTTVKTVDEMVALLPPGTNAEAVQANFHDLWTATRSPAPGATGPVLPLSTGGLVIAIGMAMTGSLFSSDSWNNIGFAGEEIQNQIGRAHV